MQTSFGVSVCSIITSEVPDDEALVTTARQEHVGAGCRSESIISRGRKQGESGMPLLLQRGGQAGDPAIVPLKGATVDKLLGHDGQT